LQRLAVAERTRCAWCACGTGVIAAITYALIGGRVRKKNYCVKKIAFLYSRIDTIHRTARGYCVAAALRDVLQMGSSVRQCAPGAIVSRVIDALVLLPSQHDAVTNTGGWCTTLSIAPRRRDAHVTIPPINRRQYDARAAGPASRRVLND